MSEFHVSSFKDLLYSDYYEVLIHHGSEHEIELRIEGLYSSVAFIGLFLMWKVSRLYQAIIAMSIEWRLAHYNSTHVNIIQFAVGGV